MTLPTASLPRSAPALHPLSPHPRLLVRWFVQYNPLFTASALCVLGGVLLVSKAMGRGADVGLTAILEIYQWLVIGVAALLYRRLHEHRPAVILGVIELVFLVDPTLQVGALAAAGETAASASWVLLFALKWRALEAAFCLRLSITARVVPLLAAGVLAGLPNARLLGVDEGLAAALAAAVFGLGALVVFVPPQVESRRALGDVGAVMFPRLRRGAVAIGLLGISYQIANALLALGPAALLPPLGALAFVVALAVVGEGAAWALVVTGLWLCALGGVGGVVGLPLAAAALVFASRNKAPRLAVAGVLAALGSVFLPVLQAGARLEDSSVVLVTAGTATFALVALCWHRRAWSALPALVVVHAPWLVTLAGLLPRGALPWGGALLLVGFVLLPAGVWLHRRLTRLLALDELLRPEAAATAPSSSAAAGPTVA